MSVQHHGAFPQSQPKVFDAAKFAALAERFDAQVNGTAKREYSQGRMGAEDDGDLAYAITTDQRHGTIVIRFGKPTEWIGLDLKAAQELRDNLTERIMALKGIPVEA